jgi:chromate reductase
VTAQAVTVLSVSGSLRRDSYNTRLLAAAARHFPAAVTCVPFRGLEAIPPFNEDSEHDPPPAVARWRAAIEDADALLLATPEYNSSLPGHLKNAIDWASRPARAGALRNKSVAVIGASSGMFGAVWAQADARKALSSAGARVLDRELAVASAADQFDDAGDLVDAELRTALKELVSALLEEVRLHALQPTHGQVSAGGTVR